MDCRDPAHRRKDLADIDDILFVQGQLDVAYLRLWADRLNVKSRWRSFWGSRAKSKFLVCGTFSYQCTNDARLTTLMADTSRRGDNPKSRRYSRLNWDGLS